MERPVSLIFLAFPVHMQRKTFLVCWILLMSLPMSKIATVNHIFCLFLPRSIGVIHCRTAANSLQHSSSSPQPTEITLEDSWGY